MRLQQAHSEERWMSRAATTMQTTSVVQVVRVVRVVLGWMLGQVSLAWRSCSCSRPWDWE